jgi:hypothetical protein
MIEFTKAAGSGRMEQPRRFFYALFAGAYFTYTSVLTLAPEPPEAVCVRERGFFNYD